MALGDPILEPLDRVMVDRVRRISLLLRPGEPLGALLLADEVVRLHRVIGRAYDALQLGEDSIALDLLIAEADESWERPLAGPPAIREDSPSAMVTESRAATAPPASLDGGAVVRAPAQGELF